MTKKYIFVFETKVDNTIHQDYFFDEIERSDFVDLQIWISNAITFYSTELQKKYSSPAKLKFLSLI